MGSSVDGQLNRSESQAAFCVVTVTYAHQLGTLLTQALLGALLAGYECAFGSHRLRSGASRNGATKQHKLIFKGQ
jgi:hypothetical protein